MAAKKDDNTAFYLIGAVILVILVLVMTKKPRTTSQYGFGFTPNGNGNSNTGSNGNTGGFRGGSQTSSTGFLCKGARGNKVKEVQNYFVMSYGANLKIDGIWGTKTQNQINAYYTQKGQNPSNCISENDYNLMSGRF